MGENSTSEISENEKIINQTSVGTDSRQIWNEIKKKWISFGLLNENDNSIETLIEELNDPEQFSKIKKTLYSYLLNYKLVMIYLNIFKNPSISSSELLNKIKFEPNENEKLGRTKLDELLEKMGFEKVIRESKKEGKTVFYEPGFSLYLLLQHIIDNEGLYDKWAFNTGRALFFLFEKGAHKETPDTKILLEKVRPDNTRFDNQYIFPAILVDDFNETAKSKKEIKKMFNDSSFKASECDLIFKCKFPLGSESNFLAELYEVKGNMRKKVESLMKDVGKFNKITKLKVEKSEYLSYKEAFYSKRSELNHRVLFYVSIRLCQYYLPNNEKEAKDVISKTFEMMSDKYYLEILKENQYFEDELKGIL